MATRYEKERIEHEFLSLIKAIDLIDKLPGMKNKVDYQHRQAIYELLFTMNQDGVHWEKSAKVIAQFEPALENQAEKLTVTFLKSLYRFTQWEQYKMANIQDLELLGIPGKKCVHPWGDRRKGTVYTTVEATKLKNRNLNPAWLFGCGWGCICDFEMNV